jgi:hypothetical protein
MKQATGILKGGLRFRCIEKQAQALVLELVLLERWFGLTLVVLLSTLLLWQVADRRCNTTSRTFLSRMRLCCRFDRRTLSMRGSKMGCPLYRCNWS